MSKHRDRVAADEIYKILVSCQKGDNIQGEFQALHHDYICLIKTKNYVFNEILVS